MREGFWLDSWQVAYNYDEKENLTQYFKSLYQEGTPIEIQIPIHKIKMARPNTLISCKAYMRRSAIDCAVASGNWQKMQFTSEELRAGVSESSRPSY